MYPQVSCFRFLLILCLFFQGAHLTHLALVLTSRFGSRKTVILHSVAPCVAAEPDERATFGHLRVCQEIVQHAAALQSCHGAWRPFFQNPRKKQSPLEFPTQTSKSCLQWCGPPAAAPLFSRVQAALAALCVPLFRAGCACVAGCGPSPCPPAEGFSPRSGAPFCFVLPVPREPLLLTSLLPLSRVSSALSHLGSDGCF